MLIKYFYSKVKNIFVEALKKKVEITFFCGRTKTELQTFQNFEKKT